jgi:O-antigen ligase
VVPLFVVPGAREPFRLPKLMLAELLGLASLFFLSFRLWSVRNLAPLGSAALLAVAPLVAVATISLLTTGSSLHSYQALIGLWIAAACLVGWSTALASRQLERCLLLLVVPGSLLALLAALQYFGLYQPFVLEGEAEGRMAVTSLAGNVGDLGAFLVLPALIAQWGAWTNRGPLRWWLALGAAFMVLGIAVTQTLAAVAGLLVGSAVLWGLMSPRKAFLPVAAAAVAIVALGLVAVEPLRERVFEKSRELARGDLDAVLTGRLDGWKAAGWMLRERPLAGVGHGAYVHHFVPAKLALQDRGVELFPHHQFPVFAEPHNEILGVAAELGLPGVAALVWAGWLLFGALRRAPIGKGRRGGRNPLAWAGVVALFVIAMVHFPFRLALTGYPAVVLLAWVFRRSAEQEAAP